MIEPPYHVAILQVTWHDGPEHRAAQHLARERRYERYQVHVARVERA